MQTPKRPVNTIPCRPCELRPVLLRMIPAATQQSHSQKCADFISTLSASLAENPANYFRADDAQTLDVGYIPKNEYAEPWPLSAQAVDKRIWMLLFRQVFGSIFSELDISSFFNQITRPLGLLMPEESRQYDWDGAIVDTGLKLGLLRENLVRLRDACVAHKRATAEPPEQLFEVSLSPLGLEKASTETDLFLASFEPSRRAFSAPWPGAAETGEVIKHDWSE